MTSIHNCLRSLFRDRELVVLRPDQTVRETAMILSFHDIGAAPVVTERQLVGIFSERDVLSRVVARGLNTDSTRIGDVMTPEPLPIHAEGSPVDAFEMMIKGGFRHLPIIDNGGTVISITFMRDIPLDYRVMHRQWGEQSPFRQEMSLRRTRHQPNRDATISTAT